MNDFLTKKKVDWEKISFEQGSEILEQLMQDLEDSNFTLEESVQAFERGKLLISHLQGLLNIAEGKIKQVN